jgi:Nuclease-related domain
VASWKEHFDAWHQIRKTNLNPIAEDGGILAGRDAEDLLRKIVNENYSFKGCHSFASKRIPDPQNQRRREIDLIVVTDKRLYVIECKNWTGVLSTAGNRWIQKTFGGQVREHENVLALNTYKMKLLVEYLKNQGITIQPDRVCQKLIFMNPKLNISSLAIAKSPDVVIPERLEEYLGKQNNQLKTHEKLFCSVIGLLLDEELKGKVLDGLEIERVGGMHHDRLIQEIAKLATWDKIFLHGTKILSGDLIGRSIPFIFNKDSHRLPLDRVKEMRIEFVKSKWLGLIKAFLKVGRPIAIDLFDPRGKSIARANGNPFGIVRFHEAGSKEPTDINLCEIDRIISGRHIDLEHRRSVAKKPIKTLLVLTIGSVLLFTPTVRDRLFSVFNNWQQSLGSSNATGTLDRYTGNYDFGRYAVKVYRQKDRLFAETASGKATLTKTSNKAGNEFVAIDRHQTNLGKYKFIKDRQGQIDRLIWLQPNGKQRNCRKI